PPHHQLPVPGLHPRPGQLPHDHPPRPDPPRGRGRVTLKRELAVAESLALEAGELLRRHRANEVEVGHKEDGEIVTAADLESDALIRAGLATAFPGDAIYSEEAADSPERLACPRVWIIDPLDATSDFVAGGDQYVVSIGLAIDRAPVLGGVYRPERQ